MYIPRVRFDVNFEDITEQKTSERNQTESTMQGSFAKVTMVEDILDGLVQNDFNPSKLHFTSINFAKRRVIQIEELLRVRDEMNKLLGPDQLQWEYKVET
jgi:hypothetical protein